MGGIKVEFGGFIGGFGKIFFYERGGVKREREGYWGCKGAEIFFVSSLFCCVIVLFSFFLFELFLCISLIK